MTSTQGRTALVCQNAQVVDGAASMVVQASEGKLDQPTTVAEIVVSGRRFHAAIYANQSGDRATAGDR
jgi:hypothetical protein